jgi:hypothetical protein
MSIFKVSWYLVGGFSASALSGGRKQRDWRSRLLTSASYRLAAAFRSSIQLSTGRLAADDHTSIASFLLLLSLSTAIYHIKHPLTTLLCCGVCSSTCLLL